jgi:hypothetical protein
MNYLKIKKMKAIEVEESFIQQVKIDFNYIIIEFGFSDFSVESIDSYVLATYFSENLAVKIMFDLRDEIIYVNLSNVIFGKVSDNNDPNNSIALVNLVRCYDPEYDIRKLMPIRWDFSKALKENANMLQKHGATILKNRKFSFL